MADTGEKTAKPSLASIRETQTANELARAIREWNKAGKPRKR